MSCVRRSAVVLTLLVLATAARSQCAIQPVTGPAPGAALPPFGGVIDIEARKNGDVLVGGFLPTIGGLTVNGIARWDGSAWSPLGAGVTSTALVPFVADIVTMPNGDVIAAGGFTTAGAVPANSVARWDGSAWSALGAGVSGRAFAVARLAGGDLVVGGQFGLSGPTVVNGVARWDGFGWQPLGAGVNGIVEDLLALPGGDLIAAGDFTLAGGVSAGRIARWDGAIWTTLGTGMNGTVRRLLRLANDELIAAGDFTTAGGVPANRLARWDGATWQPLGAGVNGRVDALLCLPNGDLLAGGKFTAAGGTAVGRIARWDGATWSPTWAAVLDVRDLARLPSGDVVVGGGDNITSPPWLEVLTTTCPALVTSAGAGCTGSAGPNTLDPDGLPWTGSVFDSTASGLTSNALALGLFGLTTTAVPLSALAPQGQSGCSQWVTADALRFYVPAGGSVELRLPIPNSVTLAGVVLHKQVLAAELDAQNAITALTSTNALTLTVGTF